jgi:hypothetical protein
MVLGRYAGSVCSTKVGVAPTDLGSSTAGIGPNACENRGLNPSALRWALSEVRRGVGYDASLGGDSVTLQLMLGTVVDVQPVLSGQRRGLIPVSGGEAKRGIRSSICGRWEASGTPGRGPALCAC